MFQRFLRLFSVLSSVTGSSYGVSRSRLVTIRDVARLTVHLGNTGKRMSTAEMVMGGRLPLKEHGRTIFVPLEDVEFLEAERNYVQVHAGNGQYRVREKLSTFAANLPGNDFVQIHRSVIVNRNRVQELRRAFSGKYTVTLASGKQVTLSRSHRRQLATLKGQQ